jgi:hypothetical protein
VLVVHAEPELEPAVIDTVRGFGHRVVAARTARDALVILERAAEQIRVALVADVVGTSRARDIVKLIVTRFPHVQCVRMTQQGAHRLLGALRKVGPSGPGAWHTHAAPGASQKFST